MLRVDAAVYRDLQLKLQSTIRNAGNVVIRQTLECAPLPAAAHPPRECFIADFRARAERNPRAPARSDEVIRQCTSR